MPCRYLGESPTERFIDMCTVGKVSLVVFPDRYHGYYLHCDAAYEVRMLWLDVSFALSAVRCAGAVETRMCSAAQWLYTGDN
jgi:hypothetical protein